MVDEPDLVRVDRVAAFDGVGRYGRLMRRSHIPLMAPTYGDLWLAKNGRLGFQPVASYEKPWEADLRDCNTYTVTLLEILHCYHGNRPSQAIRLSGSSSLDCYIYFTGITHLMSGAERLMSKVPGVHHAGSILVGLKSQLDNRGQKGRALAAREFWLEAAPSSHTS